DGQPQDAARDVRPHAATDRAAARTGGAVHRRPDAGRDPRGPPGRDHRRPAPGAGGAEALDTARRTRTSARAARQALAGPRACLLRRPLILPMRPAALVASMCVGQLGSLLPHMAFSALIPRFAELWGLSAAESGAIAGAFFVGYA